MDPFLKSRPILRLLCLIPLAALGCRSGGPAPHIWNPQLPQKQQQHPEPQSQPAPQASNRPTLGLNTTNGQKTTDFHEKATQSQQFNVHLELGRNKEKQLDFEGAAAEYQKALDSCAKYSGLLAGAQHGPQQALAHRKLADVLSYLGRLGPAEEHYLAAKKLAPADPKTWNDMGYCYYLQGRLEPAEKCLRYASQLAPDEPMIQTNLGLVLAATGRNDVALEHLSKAGGPAVGHHNLGFSLAAQGKRDEAREHYRKALELQPQLALPRQALTKLDAPPVPSGPMLSATATPPASDPAVQRAAAPPVEPSQGIPWEK